MLSLRQTEAQFYYWLPSKLYCFFDYYYFSCLFSVPGLKKCYLCNRSLESHPSQKKILASACRFVSGEFYPFSMDNDSLIGFRGERGRPREGLKSFNFRSVPGYFVSLQVAKAH